MTDNRLNLIDGLKATEGKKIALRLRGDLNDWIDRKTTGSKNSAVNFLVNVGINQVNNILEGSDTIEGKSLYKKVCNDDDN